MIVAPTGQWNLLRTIGGDYFVVGDLNARYCPASIVSPADRCLPVLADADCECTPSDCFEQPLVKTVP
jgi:hypothetical protein